MITTADILKKLQEFAPLELKAEWDNAGLLCGSFCAEVTRVMVALDPSMAALREAAQKHCELLLTHHPILFGKIASLTDETVTGRALRFAAENKINCINLHTNLDVVSGGVNDCLATALGLEGVSLLKPEGVDANGREYGLIRCGTVPQQSLADFLATVSCRLDCLGLRYIDGGKSVHRVAVGGGACADELNNAASAGCDTFVTADVRYHEFCAAAEMGINLIDAGHFETENPICEKLADFVRQSFTELQVMRSESHRDVILFRMK